MTRLHSNHSLGDRVTENLFALSFNKLQRNVLQHCRNIFQSISGITCHVFQLLLLPSCMPVSDFLKNAEIHYACKLQLALLTAYRQPLRYVKRYWYYVNNTYKITLIYFKKNHSQWRDFDDVFMTFSQQFPSVWCHRKPAWCSRRQEGA